MSVNMFKPTKATSIKEYLAEKYAKELRNVNEGKDKNT
jgi:hypothetical protein